MEENKWFWMFAPDGRVAEADVAPEGTNGAEFVFCTESEAQALVVVPEQHRWEAAQGPNWTPSPNYLAWLEEGRID